MKPRAGGGIVYFLVIVMMLLLRISQGVGVGDAVGVDIGIWFTVFAQLFCFGALPVVGWWLIVGGGTKDAMRTLPRTFGFVKCSKRDFARTLVIAVPTVLLVWLASTVWHNLLALTGFSFGRSTPSEQTYAALFSELALSALLPGVFEELTHRGELMATYRGTGVKAVFVSALLFALMHQNIQQLAHTFVLGLVAAYTMYASGSVLPAMFLHFFNNFLSVITGYGELVPVFDVINVADGWLYGSVGGLATLCVLAILSLLLILYVFRNMRCDALREGRLPVADVGAEKALPLSRDVAFLLVVAIGVAAMAFSLAWGYI